jgi:hypothetical protein
MTDITPTEQSETPITDAALIKFDSVFPGESGIAIAPQWVPAETARDLERTAAKLQAENAELRLSATALAADAARYRWLRGKNHVAYGRQNLMIGNFDADLDAAIDAALADSAKGAGEEG